MLAMIATTTFNSPEHDRIAYRWVGSGFGGRLLSKEAGDRNPPTEGIARRRSPMEGRSAELPSERQR
jgi:hypothetical protein